MPHLSPEVMIRQVQQLSTDLRFHVEPIRDQICRALDLDDWCRIDRLCLLGAGDSHSAALCTAMAFERIAGIDCMITGGQHFLNYTLDRVPQLGIDRTAFVASSSSGGTATIVNAIKAVSRYGAPTLAITGKSDSAVTNAAARSVITELQDQEASPGIRTFQSCVLSLLLLAIRLGVLKKNINQKQAACMQDELLGVADLIDDTNKQLDRWCGPVADIVAESGMIHLVGSGPCFGAAQFGASKFTEAAGLAATAQDVDSWWHVCRFTIPANLPLFVIAAPGRSDACAEQLASAAQQLGRTIIAVADARHETLLGYAAFPLPVVGRVREEFSPLLYHLFANHVACYAAQRLGRLLFQSNPSNFVKPISKDATGHFQHHRH